MVTMSICVKYRCFLRSSINCNKIFSRKSLYLTLEWLNFIYFFLSQINNLVKPTCIIKRDPNNFFGLVVALFFTWPNLLLVCSVFFCVCVPSRCSWNKVLNHQLLRVAQWPINNGFVLDSSQLSMHGVVGMCLNLPSIHEYSVSLIVTKFQGKAPQDFEMCSQI